MEEKFNGICYAKKSLCIYGHIFAGSPHLKKVICLSRLFFGESTSKFSYKSENIQHWDSLYVTQTVYYDDRVEIKLEY